MTCYLQTLIRSPTQPLFVYQENLCWKQIAVQIFSLLQRFKSPPMMAQITVSMYTHGFVEGSLAVLSHPSSR